MKYVKLFDSFINETKRLEWKGNSGKEHYKLGDRVEENTHLEIHPLPESQVDVKDGIYELQYIPIDKTDIVIDGIDTRDFFDDDDYDGYQSKVFDYMVKNFDSLPPIISIENEDGTYSLIDGHHRIIITKELGRKEILSWIYTLDQSKDKYYENYLGIDIHGLWENSNYKFITESIDWSKETQGFIEFVCQKYGIKNYTINSDGSINVFGNVDLSSLYLTELPLKFRKVTGWFDCSNNQLTSLAGGPEIVNSWFNCATNQLTNLKGSPQKVSGYFDCSDNQLTNLEGAPSVIGHFSCSHNQLTSLVGVSDVGSQDLGNGLQDVLLNCSNNPVDTIWQMINDQRFFDKINHIYTDLWLGDGWTLQGDVLEQISEELGIELPSDWIEQVTTAGYTII